MKTTNAHQHPRNKLPGRKQQGQRAAARRRAGRGIEKAETCTGLECQRPATWLAKVVAVVIVALLRLRLDWTEAEAEL